MKKNTTNSNELISLFMGVNHRHTLNYNRDWNLLMSVIERIESMEIKGIESISTGEKKNVVYYFTVCISDAQCTIDRDILPQYFGTEADFLNLYDCCNRNKIKSAYKAIVSFIEWHNKYINTQKYLKLII